MRRAVVRFVSFVSFAVASAPVLVCAQTHETVGIRAQGLAGAFVAVADDATATWWNPAGLPGGALFSAVLEVEEAGGRGVAASMPALGLSYYRLKISHIRPSSPTASATPNRQDEGLAGTGLSTREAMTVSQFGATVGQSLGDHLVVASTLKLVQAQSDTVGDLDVGAMGTFGPARLGLSIRNLRAPEFGSGVDLVVLPRRARAGIAVSGSGPAPVDQVGVSVDVDLTSETASGIDDREIAAGAEAWLLDRRLGVRAGVGRNVAVDQGSFVAVGVSVAPRRGLYVDAALTRGSDTAAHRWGVDFRVAF